MKPYNSIEVNNITKKFKIYMDKGHTLKEKMLFRRRRAYEERRVLNGISFEVKKGEAIGLIGHNGCGKSTTLKLLTRIMYPDSGTIEMRGRVSSLIELGAGFHPDMSGRENIYINASIFGLTKSEIDERLNDIIEFSELKQFIDNPVRTYSSGMYMRLAFSVAINVDADILLIDEILAVGDANFQTKCFSKLREIKESGTTIVIVSHSLAQIEQICERSIWIQDGIIKAEGSPYDVHADYIKYMEGQRQKTVKENEADESLESAKEEDRWGEGKIRFTKTELLDADGNSKKIFSTGDVMRLLLHYENNSNKKKAVFGFSFSRMDGVYCYGTNTELDRLGKVDLKKTGKVEILFPAIELLSNEYYIDLEIKDEDGATMDYIRKALKVEIYANKNDVGIYHMVHEWKE